MAGDVETKLSAARTRLILDKPFLGALVLRLPLVKADPGWCMSTATDARKLYYNEDFIKSISLEHTQFILAHEALHCALSHFVRRQHRNKLRWDVSCDYAINPLLIHDGLRAPPAALYEASFEGMTAEEIYPFIGENTDDQPMDKHLYDSEDDSDTGNGQDGEGRQQEFGEGGSTPQKSGSRTGEGAPQPHPLTESEKEQLAVQWQQRLAGAAQQAMAAGKLGGALARMVDHLLQPQLPWRMLLAKYMTAISRDDYNYSRPSRREGSAILPSLRSNQVNVVVAIDTSGSVSDTEIARFLSEIDAIKGQVQARITLLACDADLASDGPWVFEPWEEFSAPREFRGGGGTRFTPVFGWVDGQDSAPDLLVYFTDGEGQFPDSRPYYPVVWLIKGKEKPPWGERIQLN